MSPSVPFSSLAAALSKPSSLITELSASEKYFHDATVEEGKPSAIVMAENETDVIRTVLFCRKHSLSIVPRGAGTGLSGGCVPNTGAVVLSTELINHCHIDRQSKTAYVGPGLITKELQNQAAKFGLTYPPDPASYEESTLGGNVAENAGGLRCLRYGVTRDYILGIKSVTIDGEIILAGSYNHQRGFGLGDVLIGSEGTLAIITEIAVLLTTQVSEGITILAAFDQPENAAKAVRDIMRSGIVPTVMEFLDGDAVACSNQYEQTEGLDNAGALLLVEIDDAKSAQVKCFFESNHCTFYRAESKLEKVAQLWKVRRNLSKAVKQMAKIRISEDVAVPNSQFPALVAFVADLNRRFPLRINAFGHAGDGNLHVNFLSMKGSQGDQNLIEEGIAILLRKTIELGGTLTGEHGIGLAKRKYLPLEFDPPTLAFMKAIKEIFDPGNALNPGKIF